jgi:hypothetical protein
MPPHVSPSAAADMSASVSVLCVCVLAYCVRY